MTARAVLLLAVLLGTAMTAVQTPEQPPQTFRTRIDLVHVDVSVREGGRAVAGLRVEDFVLTDNGERQRIESVEATAVPIDLTLVVDVSGNPRGLWVPNESSAAALAKLSADVREISGILRPDDRIRLIATDTRVQQLLPMQSVAELQQPRPATTGGKGAVYDTLAAALLYPVEPRRRHVVVAATKGLDTISSVSAQSVRAIAERSDALFHLVAMESESDNDDAFGGFQCALMGYCWPTRQFWVPFRRRLFGPAPIHALTPDGEALRTGAAATGGGFHKAEMLNVPNLTSTFKQAFEDFRNSYVLRYTPQGQAKAGWHAIEVRVPRLRSATVRSRTGYLVEDALPTLPAAPVPSVPRNLEQLTTAYERGAFRELVAGLEQHSDPAVLIREFEGRGNPWPSAPRREAAFALELADTAIFSARAEDREAAHRLLVRFSRLIRHPLDPDIFERYWYFAVLTMLEGTLRPELTEAMLNAALERFPDEPRFVLSRAIVSEQKWMVRNRLLAPGSQAFSINIDTIRSHYEAAITQPGTAVEARLRYAWFLHGIDRSKEALEQLQKVTAAGSIGEISLRYLHQLFLGHVLKGLEREDEAMAAYRAALEVMPSAQSARVALMNAFLLRGAREQAERLAEQIQSAEPPQDLDPWWWYAQGQYRIHRQALARIREMSR
jgi:VWFA-related protein